MNKELPISFSEIVNEVQDDKDKAKHLIIAQISAVIDAQKEADNLHEQYERAIRLSNSYKTGIQNACTHLKIAPPLTLVSDNKVFEVDKEFNITITEVSL